MTQGVDHRTLPVPDGLAGERVDAAMAQMFGLSRTRAAELIARGLVLVDGSGAAKSDRVLAGAGEPAARPGSITELTSINLKREAFEKWRTGYASAYAVILFVTVFGLASIYVKALNKVKQR